MKKWVMAAMAAFCFMGSLMAQSEEIIYTEDTLGKHPYKMTDPVSPELRHVSLYLLGGMNLFDGDYTSEQRNIISVPTLGVGLEYNFNCTWGLGAEYIYRQYGVDSKGGPTYVDGKLLKGKMHQADAFMTFDVFNCFFPKAKYKIFALDLIVGGGAAWSKNSIYYPATDKNGERKRLAYAGDVPYSSDQFKACGVFLGGASFEFNISRSLELGLRCIYNLYTDDKIDGRTCSTNNDGIFDTDISLRWKIGAYKKSHVRNLASEDMLKDMVVAQAARIPAREPLKDTIVIYHKDTIVEIRDRVKMHHIQFFNNVYFANDKYDLDDQSLNVIQLMASRMLMDTTLSMSIVGYCDNTASALYNRSLGFRRAQRVELELMEEHGIAPERLHILSHGIISGKRSTSSYSANRRVEMTLMPTEQFNELYPSNATEVRIIRFGEDNAKVGTIIRVDKNETLASLARKYYNNPNCWIYLYEVNSDVIKDASYIMPGLNVLIPELTDAEKTITKEAADARYAKRKKK